MASADAFGAGALVGVDGVERLELPHQRSRRPWLASLAEVLLTFALPSGIALLAIYALGMPGKVTRVVAGR